MVLVTIHILFKHRQTQQNKQYLLEIRKYLDVKGNGNLVYQNLWDAVKALVQK